ncbi:hypothetical protein Tco_0745428 [Tanacetum coccineum]
MSITKEQQQALDDALVPREQRLTIGSCNYRLSTTFKPKEPTFQVALDVLSLTPFYPAFLITASVPTVYMQEFWATVTYQKHHIRFKMNKKSYSFDMETFRSMLMICPKPPGLKFEDPPFEEEILTFIRELGYSGNIKLLSDVKVDTLPQPWRTFGTIINKCLSGKVTRIDTLRLSRAQILWGLYHQKKIDYVYLLWEDLVFQIENKELRKNKYMFYPRFTKVIINCFMSQDQSIPRRNKVDWHMANDDPILTTMRFIPQHEVVQRYGAILPDYLTNPAMKASEAYKTYHDLATGKVQPKPKYARRSSRSKTEQEPKTSPGKRVKATAKVAKSGKKKEPTLGLETLLEVALTEAEQLKLAAKQSLIQTQISHASGSGAHEGTGVSPEVPDAPTYRSDDEEIPWKSSDEDDDDEVNVSEHEDDDDERTESDNDGDDFVHPKFSTHDDEAKQDEEVYEEDSFDPRVQTPSHVESTDDEDNDDEIHDANVEGDKMNEEETYAEDEANVLYKDVNINLEGRGTVMTDAPLPNIQATQETEDTHVILTAPINPEGQQQSSSMSSGFVSNMLNPRPDTGIDLIFNLNTEATSLVDVPVTTIAEPPLVFATTLPQPPLISSHICNKHQLPHQQVFQDPPYKIFLTLALYSDRLRDEAQAENEDFLTKLDDNIKKIIKDQVKEQVKVQVSKMFPRIEKMVNEQLEAGFMTRSSNESKTSHAIAANLFELELKKILINKLERNKSIHRSNKQTNLYNALVEAYESDKLILETYGETVTFKRRREDEDKDEEPFVGSNRGSKRRRAGKEPGSTSDPKEKTTKLFGKSNEGSKSSHKSVGQSAHAEEPMHTTEDKTEKLPSPDRDWNNTLPAAHGSTQPWLSILARNEDPRESFDELMDTPLDFSAFVMNRLNVDSLTPELLAGPTFELMKGTCKITKTKAADYGHIKWIEDLVPNTMWSPVLVDYDKHALWVTKLEIVEWQNYKHLDWITIRRDDDKLYKFKKGDLKRLRIQDIKDMLLLLVQGKLTNLTVKERLAFNVSLRMFTRSIVIQRRMEDLQLGVESYQKKLNLTKPNTYRSDLKRRDTYSAYSTPRGFIYQNKDKKNKLMRIDELHKFSDVTLDDVRTALNDRLKGIQMQYLPQTIWRQRDKENARAMIQAIEKKLKTRRIMRSLEKFVGGRPYEGDFWLMQRTI